ncbi:MAG: hypothetical protein HKN45_07395 [Flavobacteriales bacterium]|nr:hypothetical protein [Flavobacteriales bacterium]
MLGLLAKLVGGFSFALIYTYYYSYGGDTKNYFHDASILVNLFVDSPRAYIEVLLSDPAGILKDYHEIASKLKYHLGTSEWFTVKVNSLATIIGMRSYFASTLVVAGVTYIGVWKLFQVLYRRYPNAHRSLAFAVLFVPSVFFWGSGLMKDSIVIGLLGYVIYLADQFNRRGILKGGITMVFMVICSYIIFQIKAYVLISLIPAILIWIILSYRERMENVVIRKLLFPFLMVISIGAIGYAIQWLGSYTTKYNMDTVFDTAESMQTWHYIEGENVSEKHGRGSSYSLGEYDPSFAGTMVMFIPAINVTFFRPYLWEVKNIAMLAAAVESTIIFLYSLFIFLGLGFFRVLKILNRDSFLLMSLSFALFFGFAVGFTSYNFGALVRYKIPCIPFYLSSLFILQYKVREMKSKDRYYRLQARKLGNAAYSEPNVG